ncbi:hypothetical protein [Granulicella sp. L56]|nr:hypothetical protein [Granulicella sp. L56]
MYLDEKTGKRNGEIQGSLHCGGKSAAFGRDDVLFAAAVDDDVLFLAAVEMTLACCPVDDA